MIGVGFGLAAAMLAQAPTPTPRDTQLVVALPADLTTTNAELLVRHGLYGQRYFERGYGRRAATAWSRDERAASPQLQQILTQSSFAHRITDTPATDSARAIIVFRLGDEPIDRDVGQVLRAEMLAAMDTSPYPRDTLEGAWRFDALAHTIGPLRDRAFARLAADLDTRGSGAPIVVFNPTSRVRTGHVAVPLDSVLRAAGRGDLRAIDAARRVTPVARDGDSLRFVAREVPALGFKAFWVRSGRGTTGDGDTITAAAAPPLLALRVPSRAGLAGHSWSYLSLDADNVTVTAVKRAERTDAVVLRLVEERGQPAQVTLTFGRRLARVRVANLLEDPLRTLPLSLNGRNVTLALRPWDIVTLLVGEAR